MATAKSKISSTEDAGPGNSPPNYEQAVAELEKLIGEMESGKLSLEANLASYKRGTELIKLCQRLLDQVEQQVKIFEEQ
jgi:exodeoxyribonuclease VII small subunit